MKTLQNNGQPANILGFDTGNNIVNKIAATYRDEEPPTPVQECSTGRECCAFALYVNGEIRCFLSVDCWCTNQQAEDIATGMSLAALASWKTAAIGVYKLESNDIYQLYTSRNSHHNEHTVYKIHRSRVSGREYATPTEAEKREFFRLPHFERLPFSDVDALPVDWMSQARG